MKQRLITMLVLAVWLVLLLSGCSAELQTTTDQEKVENAAAEVYRSAEATSTVQTASAAAGRKLIRTVDLSMETEDFDAYIENLDIVVLNCGGYVEYSNVGGGGAQWADFVLRVPVSAMDGFLKGVSEQGVIAAQSTSQEDVTLEYVDSEARLTALRTEESSLLRLLEQATTVEDLMDIQSRLTDVRYEIEAYESRLRTMDNLVEYATVNLSVHQVTRAQPLLDNPSVWDEIGANLKENLYTLGDFFRALFVFVASALPFLAILVVVGAVVLYFAVLRPRRLRKKAEQNEAQD